MPQQSRPVTRDCPLVRLKLSRRTLNPLRTYLGYAGNRSPTVGDVVRLWEEDRLRYVEKLGPVRTRELLEVLRAAGLLHQHHGHE